jgi:hypothetical protein
MSPACVRAAALAAALFGPLVAQARDQRATSVGMRAFVEQVVLPGTELAPAPSDLKTPVVVRVLKTWPHGEHLRYDFEWVGLEPGRYDLVKYLVRKDGSPTVGLPELWVEATSLLPKGAPEPTELLPKAPQRLDGYTTMQIVAGVLWGSGLLAILFVGRRFRRREPPPPPKATLADRLRPLVEAVAKGDADTGAKAELERLLVAFWRLRLDLGAAKAGDAIVAIKRHAEAGALLRELEGWLHMPTPTGATDLQALLEPYRTVTAESLEPIARQEQT